MKENYRQASVRCWENLELSATLRHSTFLQIAAHYVRLPEAWKQKTNNAVCSLSMPCFIFGAVRLAVIFLFA